MADANLKSVAKIAVGTKRKRREINLLEVAQEIKSLYEKHTSLEQVANLVKLSPEMVRQFLKINILDAKVKELIRVGLIEGVDISYRISKLEKKDQVLLAKYVLDKRLSSDDVRSIVRYKLDNTAVDMGSAVSRVLKSKDKKIYVAYMGIEKDSFEPLSEKATSRKLQKIVRNIFEKFLPDKSIISFELNGRVVIIKVLKDGLIKLREKAKRHGVTLANLADALIRDYLEEKK